MIKNLARILACSALLMMTSCYRDSATTYTLTLNNGNSSGFVLGPTSTSYNGSVVGGAVQNVYALDQAGEAFYEWYGSSGITSPYSYSTSITMPYSDTTISVLYRTNSWQSCVPVDANFTAASVLSGGTGITVGGNGTVSTSQNFSGKNVGSFSVSSAQSAYITTASAQTVTVTVPANVLFEVWDIDGSGVIATNVPAVGNVGATGTSVSFSAQPNHRYGGFAWFIDNSTGNISVSAN